MRMLLEVEGIPLPISSPPSVIGDRGSNATSWPFSCHGLWYNLALTLPSSLFIVYLLSKARNSLTKLSLGRSYIMISYYGLLWLVSILNLIWSCLQAWQCSSGKETAWNLLSLFTSSGMLFLEISLLAFLLQGNYCSGIEALMRTFVISGIIVAGDIFLKAIYVFGFGVPLFIDSNETTNRVKWGLWVVHKLILAAAYGSVLFVYHSKWRERLPARPAFYNYILMMFLLNAMALFSCILVANGAGFGFWLYDLTTIFYHSLYLPFLYLIFLADFFQEEDLHLENLYCSEMKDAGYFDADWD